MDQYQGLTNVIRQAIRDTWSEGQDYVGQTGNAVRMVQAVRPDMGTPEALVLVKRFRGEN